MWLQRSSVCLVGVDGCAVTHIALQAGHSYRCFSNSKRASFTRRTSCSGRSIPESFTASRDAHRNSRASEFPAGQNSAFWSRVIGSLRSTPIPSVFAGESFYLPNTSGAFYPGHYWMTLNLEHPLIGNWICPLSNDYPYPGDRLERIRRRARNGTCREESHCWTALQSAKASAMRCLSDRRW